MSTIQAGQTLTSASTYDGPELAAVTVVKRTPTTATVVYPGSNGPKRCKIHTDSSGDEYVMAWGVYSQAPCFKNR